MAEPAFTDIHSHFLFSVDDGARDIEHSLNMLDQAVLLNIKHAMATPHATELTDNEISQQFLDHFAILKKRIAEENIPIQISLGAELFFGDRIYDWLHYPWATFNNNKKFLLFELPLYDLPAKVGDFIFQCRLKGLNPILAHPERYVYLHDNIEQLLRWSRQGCLMQMNAGSLVGQFGETIATFSKRLFEANFYQFVASDAHDVKYRSYGVMQECYMAARDIIPAEQVDQIFIENPHQAIAGEPVMQIPVIEENVVGKWDKLLSSMKKIRKIFKT